MFNLTKVILSYSLFVRKVRLLLQVANAGTLRHGYMPRDWGEMTADDLEERGFSSTVRTGNHEPSALSYLKGHRCIKTPANSDVIDCHELGGLAGFQRREFKFLRWLGNGDGVRGEFFLAAVKRFDCASGTGRARMLWGALAWAPFIHQSVLCSFQTRF